MLSLLPVPEKNKTLSINERSLTSTAWTEYHGNTRRIQKQTIPTSAIPAETVTVDGLVVSQRDHAGITSTQMRRYTASGMTLTQTDGRGNTTTRVTYAYDYLGRRATKKVETITTDAETEESTATTTLHQRYLYRGYLQVACCDLTRSAHPCLWLITWDPTQPVATRPLAIQKDGTWYCYGWDLTKNICEIFGSDGYIKTAYSYTPYGAVTASGTVTQPIQWSSEFNDEELGLIYYNYRHYNPTAGKWIGRDRQSESVWLNRYNFVNNAPTFVIDLKGDIIWIPVIIAIAVAGSLLTFSVDSEGVEASNEASEETANDTTQPSRVEYCGCICRHKYLLFLIHTGPVRGTSTARSSSCQPLNAPCPPCYKMVASYHSHTARSNYGPFSEADLNFAQYTKVPIYVGRGFGNVDRAAPNGDITIIRRN